MSVLGRGLASLIPSRGSDSDEAIDTMEVVEDEINADESVHLQVEDESTDDDSLQDNSVAKTVSVMEEFEEFDEMDAVPAPEKPLTTPISIDLDNMDESAPAASLKSEQKLSEAILEEKVVQVKKSVTVHAVEEDEEEEEMTAVVADEPVDAMKEEEVSASVAGLDELRRELGVTTPKAVDGQKVPEKKVEQKSAKVMHSRLSTAAPKVSVPKKEAITPVAAAAVASETVEAAPELKVSPVAILQEKEVVDEPVKSEKPSDEHLMTEIASEKNPVAKKEDVVDAVAPVAASEDEDWDRHENNVEHIALGDITINPLQPRRSFDPEEMEELKASIEQHGILQPLVVRRLEGGKYELIAGERRLRATKSLEWTKVPAVVRRNVASDDTRLVYALIENVQRENLNPIEEAQAYDQLNKEYGLTHEEIGERVGKTRVRITNIMRVLKLPAEIQRGLSEGKITSGHAKAILMIPDEEKQIKFYQHMLEEGLTVRKAETRARRIQRTMNITDAQRKRIGTRHPLAQRYSPMLEDRFGYDARIKYNEPSNRFEIVFRAHNNTELEELVGRMLGTAAMPMVDEGLPEEGMEG